MALSLSGCASLFNKRPKFPESSELLTTKCEKLDAVPEGTTKLSEAEIVVNGNYTKYHKCASTVDAWIEWYNLQKKNFEGLGK